MPEPAQLSHRRTDSAAPDAGHVTMPGGPAAVAHARALNARPAVLTIQRAAIKLNAAAKTRSGVAINDDARLESEADTMGARALGLGQTGQTQQDAVAVQAKSAVVQRAHIDLTAMLGGAGRFISSIGIDRVETPNFATGAGDHGTAFIVLRHWAENALGGRPVAAVGAVFDAMMATVVAMPGNHRPLTPEQLSELDLHKVLAISAVADWKSWYAMAGAAAADGVIEQRIIDVVNSIINFRNHVPLSAVEFGGTGHGEGPAANFLDGLNHRLATGGAAPSAAERNKAAEQVGKLFDVQAFSDFTEGEDHHDAIDMEMMRGAGPGAYKVAQDQHLLQIAASYPLLWPHISAQATAAFRKLADGGGNPKDLDEKKG